MSYLSVCCGAEPHEWFYFEDGLGICSCCQEHADFEEWEEGADADMKHWEQMVELRKKSSGD